MNQDSVFALLLVVELQDIAHKEGAPNPAAQRASSLSAGGRSYRIWCAELQLAVWSALHA